MFLSFPEATEMFQLSSFPLAAYVFSGQVTGHDPGRVSPFGNPRIVACLAAPRGLSQPYYVLRRFLAPDHPPCTLRVLTTKISL